jgi:hypothetical protein
VNKKNDPSKGFDCYAKTKEAGYRTLTINNKNNETSYSIAEAHPKEGNNGKLERVSQTVYLDRFNTMVYARAVVAHIEDLDATKLARVKQ